MQQLFTDLDLDHDGIITEAELQALDANKDGTIDIADMDDELDDRDYISVRHLQKELAFRDEKRGACWAGIMFIVFNLIMYSVIIDHQVRRRPHPIAPPARRQIVQRADQRPLARAAVRAGGRVQAVPGAPRRPRPPGRSFARNPAQPLPPASGMADCRWPPLQSMRDFVGGVSTPEDLTVEEVSSGVDILEWVQEGLIDAVFSDAKCELCQLRVSQLQLRSRCQLFCCADNDDKMALWERNYVGRYKSAPLPLLPCP